MDSLLSPLLLGATNPIESPHINFSIPLHTVPTQSPLGPMTSLLRWYFQWRNCINDIGYGCKLLCTRLFKGPTILLLKRSVESGAEIRFQFNIFRFHRFMSIFGLSQERIPDRRHCFCIHSVCIPLHSEVCMYLYFASNVWKVLLGKNEKA